MTAFVILCCVLYLAAVATVWITNALEEVRRQSDAALATHADDWNEPSRAQVEMTWTDEALGRVLAALDETEETFDPTLLPISQSPAAQRIRAQIAANHDAEVARFRDELDGWGGAA